MKAAKDKHDEFELLDDHENLQSDMTTIRLKMRQMILENKPITLEEKGHLIQCMYIHQLRNTMTEILIEVGPQPKPIASLETLRLISDIIKFILTLFVHEQGVDYRLLSAILDIS